MSVACCNTSQTILNLKPTILNVTPAACCRIHRREREELHARFRSRLNSNAVQSTMLARAKKKRAKPFALNHPSLLLQVASTPSLLGNSSITSIIDSTTTLLSALSTSSLKPSSNTHTSAWSCVSSVVQATQTSVSRSRASEAAAANFADESARKLAAFAVRSQLAGQAPIVFSKDTSALKTAVGGQLYCCVLASMSSSSSAILLCACINVAQLARNTSIIRVNHRTMHTHMFVAFQVQRVSSTSAAAIGVRSFLSGTCGM